MVVAGPYEWPREDDRDIKCPAEHAGLEASQAERVAAKRTANGVGGMLLCIQGPNAMVAGAP
jgi:hypothetical protein